MKIDKTKMTNRIYNLLPDHNIEHNMSSYDMNITKEKLSEKIYETVIGNLIIDNPNVKFTIV